MAARYTTPFDDSICIHWGYESDCLLLMHVGNYSCDVMHKTEDADLAAWLQHPHDIIAWLNVNTEYLKEREKQRLPNADRIN